MRERTRSRRYWIRIPQQLHLPGVDTPPEFPHKLFLAALPPRSIALQMAQRAFALRRQYGLRDLPFPPNRLHVSLHGLGEYPTFPAKESQLAARLAGSVRAPKFRATFDRAMSFGRMSTKQLRHAVVMTCDEGRHGFATIQRAIADRLRIEARRNFTAHITLLYDESMIEETHFDPFRWTVEEFVLIHSVRKEMGEPKKPYSILGRWKLN